MKGKLCNIFEKKLKTDRFYDEIESTTVWEILGEIFGVDFGGPSLWRTLAIANFRYIGPKPLWDGCCLHRPRFLRFTFLPTYLQ